MTRLPTAGRDTRGPAHACHSSELRHLCSPSFSGRGCGISDMESFLSMEGRDRRRQHRTPKQLLRTAPRSRQQRPTCPTAARAGPPSSTAASPNLTPRSSGRLGLRRGPNRSRSRPGKPSPLPTPARPNPRRSNGPSVRTRPPIQTFFFFPGEQRRPRKTAPQCSGADSTEHGETEEGSRPEPIS